MIDLNQLPPLTQVGVAADPEKLSALIVEALADREEMPFYYWAPVGRGQPASSGRALLQEGVAQFLTALTEFPRAMNALLAAHQFFDPLFIATSVFPEPKPKHHSCCEGWQVNVGHMSHGVPIVVVRAAWVLDRS